MWRGEECDDSIYGLSAGSWTPRRANIVASVELSWATTTCTPTGRTQRLKEPVRTSRVATSDPYEHGKENLKIFFRVYLGNQGRVSEGGVLLFSIFSTTHEFLFGALAELVDNARWDDTGGTVNLLLFDLSRDAQAKSIRIYTGKGASNNK